jgi:alpha,alpha-trehalose phosphorylase
MATKNLRAAADVAGRYPERAAELGVDHEEISRWQEAAERMLVPFDDKLGVTAQSEGFTRYRRWDFDSMREDEFPLLLHFPYYLLYSSQVVKQADLVFALFACGDHFTDEQKAIDFDHYERVTVRDSSLSASIQAIVAAEVGQLDLAYDYFHETAMVDLRDHAGNTDDGLHLAALAGSWLVAVAGFGGMRDHGDRLAFSPRLPTQLDGITFRLVYRDRRLLVAIRPDGVRYELLAGDPLDVIDCGDVINLSVGAPVDRPLKVVEPRGKAEQPPGCEPWHARGRVSPEP